MVLFIVGLLLAGALIPLTTQMEIRSIAETRRVMDQINEAIVGFAQANGRLPCPANPTLATGTSNAGVELYTAPSCTALMGVIPWATLGVPETDAWGRRFTYRVASVFSDAIASSTFNTDTSLPTYLAPAPSPNGVQTSSLDCTGPAPTPTQSSFALCSLGEIAVLDRSINAALVHSTSVLGSGLPAVFVSHGKNGHGGYQTDGVQIAGLTASTDQAANAAGGTWGCPSGTCASGTYFYNYLFYSRAQTPTPDIPPGCSENATGLPFCEFDDIVYMISAPTLVSRMVSAGRLP